MRWLTLHARPAWMLRAGLLVMLIIAVGAAFSSLAVQRQARQSLLVNNYIEALDRVHVAVLQMENGQRGYLITGQEPSLVPYEEGRRTIATALGALSRFNPVAMGLTAATVPIIGMVADKVAELDRTVALRRNFGSAAAEQVLVTGAGRTLMTALRDELAGLRQQALSLLEQRQDHFHFEAYMTVSLIVVGLLLSGGLAATSVALLRREIAARQAIETALRERQAALARSNDELDQFAHIASHDLQEPLRMISSYTQLLRRRYAGKLDSDADEFIGYAVDGTKRMQALINDLLNFSRVSSAARPLEPVDLEATLHDTLKDLEIRIEDCGATVTHGPLPTVCGDSVQLRQLLLNLIGNGMKFQPPERKPAVDVSAVLEGHEWHFGVRDNGIGIDAQYFKNLFQIFKRLQSGDEYPGTGIGLAVCKKIVERHGGQIWIESALGQGSTFLFTLPAMEAQ
ncbi:MAG TPA: ATP-binding protein [Stellaceae bacterium]|nr:ATP-binding protein [Stellaceae bacterium]